MPRNPASLGRRLLIGAGVFITGTLFVAVLVVAFILQRFITGQIDGRLDTQIVFLSSMVRTTGDGAIALSGNADGPPFDGPARGWYWEVIGPKNAILSRSLGNQSLTVPTFHPPPRNDRPAPADGPGPDRAPLHFRIQPFVAGGIPIVAVATAPREAIDGPLHEAMRTLALALAILGLALIGAMLLQVRLGLRPLDRLRDAVVAIRAGKRERLPEAQPFEVRPLVIEINALLDQNAATLERARSHVANLAHGLKTPLSTLALGLAEGEADKAGKLRDLIDQIERRIRHHLGRARSAALSGPVRMRVPIARIGDLVETLAKIYAARTIAVTQEFPRDLAVACEPQDFDEMIGNLLDNAFKWSRGRIAIRATSGANRDVAIAIADDGKGLEAAQLPQLLRPGMRADETAPGFGFGLSITRELAELYGGTLDFATSPWGGLEVTLRLPCAP